MSEQITLFGRDMTQAETIRAGDPCPACGATRGIELEQYQRTETHHHAAYCCRKCRATFGRAWEIE